MRTAGRRHHGRAGAAGADGGGAAEARRRERDMGMETTKGPGHAPRALYA